MPLPVQNLRQILAVLGDIILVLYQEIIHLLIQMACLISQLRQMFQRFLNKAETVYVILNPHVEGSGNSAFFNISVNIETLFVGSSLGKLVNKLRISVESEYNRLVLCKDLIELVICQSVRMVDVRFHLHQVYHVDKSYLYVRQAVSENCCCGKGLQCRSVAAAGHNKVRLSSLIAACPVPYAYSLSAVNHRLIHSQPLHARMF